MNKIFKSAENPIPEEEMAAILMELPAKRPTVKRQAAMKKSLLARVDKLAASEENAATGAMRIVRADEGRWITFAPNVEMKVLNDDGVTRSWLARFGPGGHIPAHWQSDDEEAIILEGWCTLDGIRINQGDYNLVTKGARHGDIHSPEGCIIFVRSHSQNFHASNLATAR